jgi:hypothetical protein
LIFPITRATKPSFFFSGAGGAGGISRPSLSAAKLCSTSSSIGKRPALDFEKISRPSTITSNCPDLPALISVFSPNLELSDAARLAARGL